jgi:hypothetical protein
MQDWKNSRLGSTPSSTSTGHSAITMPALTLQLPSSCCVCSPPAALWLHSHIWPAPTHRQAVAATAKAVNRAHAQRLRGVLQPQYTILGSAEVGHP